MPAMAVLLGGCSEPTVQPVRATARKAASPGTALRATAGRDSARLLTLYDAAVAAHPALAELLEPLRAEVARHAQAFGADAEPDPSASPQAPATATAAVAALAAAEKSLADARTTALLDAPPELARLLASVAAAGAVHVLLLKEG